MKRGDVGPDEVRQRDTGGKEALVVRPGLGYGVIAMKKCKQPAVAVDDVVCEGEKQAELGDRTAAVVDIGLDQVLELGLGGLGVDEVIGGTSGPDGAPPGGRATHRAVEDRRPGDPGERVIEERRPALAADRREGRLAGE
jgi:hypothetical protein